MTTLNTHFEEFKNLTKQEADQLLKFPLYISLLAANADGKMDNEEKKTAIKFTHIKTFSSDPKLKDFYAEVSKTFEQDIDTLDRELPKERHERQAAIEGDLSKLKEILLKLPKEYQAVMLRSMQSYKDHVSHAHYNVLESFVLPIVIQGITDPKF
ncbi:MAG: hypothetical protein ACTHJ0_11865 [Flavipsychrobacter sp.]